MIIAQLTDMHIGAPVDIDGRRIDPAERLARAVAHLNRMTPRPDVVLLTGDLVASGSDAEYVTLKALLEPLAMPVLPIPGNHDTREGLRAAFPGNPALAGTDGFLHHVVEDYPLRLIGLDTLDPGKESGLQCPARLAWVAARLAEAPERPTLIYMHHPPLPVAVPMFDAIACHGGAALGEIVARHPQVEAILCGHVHRAISQRWCGTVVHVTPSPSYQYALEMVDEDADPVDEPPACRILVWRPDSGLAAHLSYIAA